MCILPTPTDNSADIARQAELDRQARITEGTTEVDRVFSQFDDSFFGDIEQSSNDFFLPQVQDQYTRAFRDLVLNLGRVGRLNSSSGARQLGDLKEALSTEQTNIANQSVTSSEQARTNVENDRAAILTQLGQSADPVAAAATASARASSLSAPTVYSPLADLFSQFVDVGGTTLALEAKGFPGFGTGIFDTGGGGSERVVS